MTKIVLIDEDISFVNQMAKLLIELRPDWTVRFASSAAEGIELVESLPVDVVVSDTNFPDMDGAALLERIRSY
ncbi:MAG: CheY-like chemotaxis protein, partial [Granulosicoccus sp.]